MSYSKKIISYGLMIFITLAITSCNFNEDIWKGKNSNPIYVACGESCRTIVFQHSPELTHHQRRVIQHFVYRIPKNHAIYISSCARNPARSNQIRQITQQIKKLGRTPVLLKPTLPFQPSCAPCVNLIRGKLHIVPPYCPNLTVSPNVDRISSNFGCATNRNLALMIVNPRHLLAMSGEHSTEGTRVSLGVVNYRTGKQAKLDSESSSGTTSESSSR